MQGSVLVSYIIYRARNVFMAHDMIKVFNFDCRQRTEFLRSHIFLTKHRGGTRGSSERQGTIIPFSI